MKVELRVDTFFETLHQRFTSRDPRLEGRYFVGANTTRMFCRPTCYKRRPKLSNCVFFTSASEAIDAGFSPCKCCRPELPRDRPAARGTLNTVVRGLRLIAAGEVDESDGESLAARLGIGERHLRRLFLRHLGTSPGVILGAQRTYLVEKMARETSLPMTEIAYASGFRSLRRFNAAIKEHFGCSPRDLRQRNAIRHDNAAQLRVSVRYTRPYDWAVVARYLQLTAIPHVEHVDSRCYRRSTRIGDSAGVICVELAPAADRLTVAMPPVDVGEAWKIAERLRVMFDLDANPRAIEGHLGRFPELEKAIAEHPGIRVPGGWDRFEMVIRTLVECHTGPASQRLLSRTAQNFGRPVVSASRQEGIDRLFPEAAELARADLASTGLPPRLGHVINAIATAISNGSIRLESGDAGPAVEHRLVELGIDVQTAQYVGARLEDDGDASGFWGWRFQSLSRMPDGQWPATAFGVSKRWSPWQGYAAMALWAHREDSVAPTQRVNSLGRCSAVRAPGNSLREPRPQICPALCPTPHGEWEWLDETDRVTG
jgi:AraC family transcriptional regulator of adaptative response / DNA-3-methyladenine glycosylase II